MKISLIAAIANQNVIGVKNRLPWHLPADLKHFKDITLNKPVIMGRKTFESIGRPLPQRDNIIITSSPDYQAKNCKIYHSLEEAIANTNAPEVFIIGGESLYNQGINIATHLYITFVHANIAGDTFFPTINPDEWQEITRTERPADEANPYDLSFVTLNRR